MLNLNKTEILKKEFVANIKLLFPIYCSQMLFVVLSVTDNILVGNYSSHDLASLALGSSIWIPLYSIYEGILRACIPIISIKVGKGEKEGAINTIYEIIFISIIVGLVYMLILNNSEILFNIVGAPKEIIKLAKEYLQIIAFTSPVICLYQGMRAFCEGYNKNTLIMAISLIGIGINIPINYVLVYGKFGFPSMGAIGCGWATSISMCFMCICLFVYLHSHSILKLPKLVKKLFIPNIFDIIYILKLGVPIGMNLFIDAAVISFTVLLLSSYGEIVISSYEIALNVNYIMIVASQSLSIVLIIRLSEKIGTKKYDEAMLLKWISVIQAFILSLILIVLVISTSSTIAGYYTQDIMLTRSIASLIPFVVVLYTLESFQIMFNGILYVYKDTLATFIIFVLSYCIIALPLGYILSLTNYIFEPMAAEGFLSGLIVGTILNIVLSLARICQNVKKAKYGSTSILGSIKVD